MGLESSLSDSQMYEKADPGEAMAVNVADRGRSLARGPSRKSGPDVVASRNICKYCGRNHVFGRQHCPARDERCRYCHSIGHFAVVCRKKAREQRDVGNVVSEQIVDSRPEDESSTVGIHVVGDYAFGLICKAPGRHDPRFWITLEINGQLVSGLLDTGATRTICPRKVVRPERASGMRLQAYGGKYVPTLGVAFATFKGNGRTVQRECFVVSDEHCTLFGQDVIRALCLIQLNDTGHKEHVSIVNTSSIDIAVNPDAVPVASPCRRHAFSIRPEIEKELARLLRNDIIEPVREASSWVSPIVPSRKANGNLRLCIDYRQLNKHIIRERRAMPTVQEITAQLHGYTVFSVLDAEAGFHQLALSESSRHLTTFTTHIGLFRFKRLPFGIACAPEVFQRVLSDMLSGIPGVHVYVDDILVAGEDMKQHDQRLEQVMKRLQDCRLKLNEAKCKLRQKQVKYLGCILTADGVSPDPDKIAAIKELPEPKTLRDVRQLLGMVNYLGKFLPGLSDSTELLRRLAKQEPFTLSDELIQAFHAVRSLVAEQMLKLSYFDVSLKSDVCISSDASPYGLGAVLWQRKCKEEWKPVSCASRSLSETERRYSQLEREMLGIVFGLVKFRQYILGRHVLVYTDHKPLIHIVKKSFDDVPARIQRWLMALLPYDFSLQHMPGSTMTLTDAFSRLPRSTVQASPEESRSMREFVGMVLSEAPVTEVELREHTEQDSDLNAIRRRVQDSRWSDLTDKEEPYFKVRSSLTVIEGVIMFDQRFVIPSSLRQKVLRIAHEGHPGRDGFLDTLRQSVWWPGLTADACRYSERCSFCWQRKTNRAEPLRPSDVVPVWYRIGVDLVEIERRHLLSIIDYGSRYSELLVLSNTTSGAVIQALTETFARYGLPVELISDNGPQFAASEMEQFLRRLDIKHLRASPRYPCANGMVERFHATVRQKFAALDPSIPFGKRLQQVLFLVRTCVNRMIGMAPAEAFLGRPVRTRLIRRLQAPTVRPEEQIRHKLGMAARYDQKFRTVDLPELVPGTPVILQDGYTSTDKQWRVVRQQGRQVVVSDGIRTVFRNRRHVRTVSSDAEPCNRSIKDSGGQIYCGLRQQFPSVLQQPPVLATEKGSTETDQSISETCKNDNVLPGVDTVEKTIENLNANGNRNKSDLHVDVDDKTDQLGPRKSSRSFTQVVKYDAHLGR